MRRLVWLAVAGATVYAVTFVAVLLDNRRVLAAHGGDTRFAPPLPVALVLSSGALDDGRINHASRQRTRLAVRLLQNGSIGQLIFSGGGQYGPDNRSSAAIMRDYAVASGAPAHLIVIEERSRTTFENLRLALPIAGEMGTAPDGTGIVIVTGGTHLTRTRILAAYLGRDKVSLAASDGLRGLSTADTLLVVGREAAAWWYNLGKVAVWAGLGALGVPEAARAEVVN